jgi:hypothetical protein
MDNLAAPVLLEQTKPLLQNNVVASFLVVLVAYKDDGICIRVDTPSNSVFTGHPLTQLAIVPSYHDIYLRGN